MSGPNAHSPTAEVRARWGHSAGLRVPLAHHVATADCKRPRVTESRALEVLEPRTAGPRSRLASAHQLRAAATRFAESRKKKNGLAPPLRKGPPAPTPSFLSSPQRDNKRLPVPPSGRGPRPPGRSQEPGQTPAAVAGDPAGRPRPARGELLGRYLGSVPSAASVSGPPREDGTSFREDEPDSPQPLPGKKSTCDAGHEAGAAQRPAQPETDSQRKQRPNSAGEERGQVLNTVPASEVSRVSKR